MTNAAPAELINEGCTSPAGESAFRDFNNLLPKNAVQLEKVIDYIALNEAIEPDDIPLADVVNRVLDETGDGAQIGTSDFIWGKIFDDPGHKIALTSFRKATRKMSAIKKTIDIYADLVDDASLLAIIQKNAELAEQQQEATGHRRAMGLCALRVVAGMNILSDENREHRSLALAS